MTNEHKSKAFTDLRESYRSSGIIITERPPEAKTTIKNITLPVNNEENVVTIEEIHNEGPVVIQEEQKVQKVKRKKHRWVTREIAEILGREYILLTTLRDTLFFAIFLILMSTISLGAHESESYNLYRAMTDVLLTDNNFEDVNTASRFWTFLEDFFTNSFYWDYWYYPDYEIMPTSSNERSVLYENKLIGVPRLRQLKVRGDSCKIHHYFRQIVANCYGKFSKKNEDTATFGPGSDTAWKYTPEVELLDFPYWGKFAWYHGGGFYKDLTIHRNETLEIIESLKENLWVTRGTRVIFLDWTMYNSNLNLFMQYRVAFEFPPSGGVVGTPTTEICPLLHYTRPFDFFILACELVSIGFIIYYTIEEVREMIYFKWKYIWRFWSWVDVAVLAFGYAAIGLRIYAEIQISKQLLPVLETPTKHSNLQILMKRMILYKFILSWQLFFIYMKIFKYLNFNKSMAQLNKTLSQCRKDMLGFGVMFFVIFIAFAILGYLIFGTEVETFSNFYLAMFTLLRTILGDFDYTDIEKANRIIAPIFFLMFIFLVFFVLLNMFLAIINDTYVDVKTELAIAPEEMRMSGFVKRGYYNILIKMGLGRHVKFEEFKKNEYEMTTSEIKGALKRIGFSDLEIEMFFARFNLDKSAQMQNFNMDDLLNILQGKTPENPDAPKKGKGGRDDFDEPLIVIDDFLEQQEQLQKIEDTITETTKTLQNLLEKLERMDNVRKVKLQEIQEAQPKQ